MLNKVLKLCGLDDVENYMDFFLLSEVILKKEQVTVDTYIYDLFISRIANIIFIGIILSVITTSIFLISLTVSFLFISAIFMAIFFPNLEIKNQPKFKIKFYKKIIKKDIKSSLKDPEFKIFLETYFQYIKDKKLSKKEIVHILNNWKNHKKIFKKDMREKEILKVEKIIKLNRSRLEELINS